MSAPNQSYDPVEVTPLHPDEVVRARDEALAAVAAASDLDALKEVRLAHAGDRSPLALANREIGANEVLSSGGLAKLSIVGTGMLGTPGIAARMFKTLAEQKINIEMISTSEIRITCLVARSKAEEGVRALHSAFELDQA